MISQMETNKKLYICGHRGYRSQYPENTLLAFHEAIKLGVDMLEFDLALSRDNILMILHDDTVDRTTNGHGRISELTYVELKRLDAGVKFGKYFEGLKIPTFEELLEMITPYRELLLNVEIKKAPNDIKACDKAVALLRQYGFIDNIVLNSIDARVVAHAHDVYGTRTHGFPGKKMFHFDPGENGTYSKMWCACLDMPDLTPAQSRELTERSIILWTCPADNEETVKYAIQQGVRCVICNDPIPALQVARELGLR